MKTMLRSTAFVALLGVTVPGAVLAQTDHDAHHPSDSAATAEASKYAEGTVKKIDKSAGKLTIAHGPLETLAMPPMTMVFRAADAAMLDRVKAGDKIRFAVEKIGGALTVTDLEVTP